MNKSSGRLNGRFSERTEIERYLHRHELQHRAPGRLAHPLGTLAVHGYPALLRKDTNLSCRRRPVNDYPGLNSLMRRLANPGWDGLMKDIHTGLILEDGRIRPLGGTLTETDAGSVTPFLRFRFR